MSSSFHLAIPAGDLKKAEAFYTNILGCKTGNREDGKWVDIDFWGNELTLHQTSMKLPRERHDVDMGQVPVPHFGVNFDDVSTRTLGHVCKMSFGDQTTYLRDWLCNSKYVAIFNVKDYKSVSFGYKNHPFRLDNSEETAMGYAANWYQP